MQYIRRSRKRAGTLTNAIPQDSARRIRLDPSPESGQDDKDSKVDTWLHNHVTPPKVTTTSPMPIPIPVLNDCPTRYITPPTPCSSPEPRGHPSCQAGLDWFGYPINVQHNRPGYSPAHQRSEFPFPIQPLPRQLQKIRLELTIPEEPEPAEFDVDVQDPTGKTNDRVERPHVHPLPTPPRSHPSIPTFFSYSPPSSSHEAPTPSSTAPSSGLPSLSSSSHSPSSPKTPNTPLSRFNSAANALKLVLMANDIGMSLQELEELNEFAAAPTSGSDSGSSKRAGRVLVRKDIQQRREKGSSELCNYGGQDPFHQRDECTSEKCRKHTSPGLWRDITWSRFSDTTDEDVSMSGVNMELDRDGEGDDEVTALEGYIKMAVNANAGADDDVRGASGSVDRSVLGTAEVGRRVRPAELYMKCSVERVEAAVGPLRERVWP